MNYPGGGYAAAVPGGVSGLNSRKKQKELFFKILLDK